MLNQGRRREGFQPDRGCSSLPMVPCIGKGDGIQEEVLMRKKTRQARWLNKQPELGATCNLFGGVAKWKIRSSFPNCWAHVRVSGVHFLLGWWGVKNSLIYISLSPTPTQLGWECWMGLLDRVKGRRRRRDGCEEDVKKEWGKKGKTENGGWWMQDKQRLERKRRKKWEDKAGK